MECLRICAAGKLAFPCLVSNRKIGCRSFPPIDILATLENGQKQSHLASKHNNSDPENDPEVMTPEQSISERCKSRIDTPELAPRRRRAMLARGTLTALLCLLASPRLVRAQATLQTPATDDPECVGNECPADRRPSASMANPALGKGGNQTVSAPPPLETLPDNGEQERDAESARHPNRGFPLMRNAIPETRPNEFQEFVAGSVGRKLPIYGYNLFDGVPTTFAPDDRIPVTDDYRIGSGDEILIRAWGQIDLDGKLVVDRGGEVFLPKVGTLSVAGLKYQQLPEYFRTAIGRVFRNFDLTISLGQLRSIQVFVVGQARRPGSYTVSSLCTLVNALFASGGPSSTGSMRHIQLKRNDSVVSDFDFYDLLLRGDKSKDAWLLPGDVIYIPPAGPSIAMAGSVNVPAIYELREETTLRGAVEMAGGLATTADGQKAVVERIDNHTARRVEEFPLDDQGLQRALKDGDVVRILALSPRFENAVTLRGNVAHPGRVEWHSGMRLRDVIPNQDALLTRGHWRSTNWAANAGERDDQQI